MVCQQTKQINYIKQILQDHQFFYHPMSSSSELTQSKNRNFICSCNKAYLSYAALFTHIKQKHGGKAPGQIIRPRSENKRGRPRKNDKNLPDKPSKNPSNNGFLDNNNSKYINQTDQLKSAKKAYSYFDLQGKGFQSYQGELQRFEAQMYKQKLEMGFSTPANDQNPIFIPPKQLEDQAMDFMSPNNELSSNTIALASVIINLQQLIPNTNIQQVSDYQLEKFSAYIQLRKFYSQMLQKKSNDKAEEDLFLLGNVICAFLNFCQRTLELKAAYQQILLVIVGLLQHLFNKKGTQVLRNCRKDSIQECLPSYCQQYLDKVIIKSKSKYWVYRQNNAFRVLVIFLSWLSVIQADSNKSNEAEQQLTEKIHQEEKLKHDQTQRTDICSRKAQLKGHKDQETSEKDLSRRDASQIISDQDNALVPVQQSIQSEQEEENNNQNQISIQHPDGQSSKVIFSNKETLKNDNI